MDAYRGKGSNKVDRCRSRSGRPLKVDRKNEREDKREKKTEERTSKRTPEKDEEVRKKERSTNRTVQVEGRRGKR